MYSAAEAPTQPFPLKGLGTRIIVVTSNDVLFASSPQGIGLG
jgi:hypothetical protein